METFFNPSSIAIYGLSDKKSNIPRLILENLIRWGYRGRIFGIHPGVEVRDVDGVRMYKDISQLPVVPDLAVSLVPARFIPGIVEECGKAGVKRMAIPSGGFNELGEDGRGLAEKLMENAKKYGVRFVGPNGVTLASTSSGLCLPFVPSYPPLRGGLSIITQSGGVGLMLWNLMTNENVGMAKFASIGNKLDMDEVDFLEYFGNDPETKVIGLYLESIDRGRELLEAASRIDKPILLLKSNTTDAGQKAAVSHTAAMSSNDDILNDNISSSGIIRIDNFVDFVNAAKAFKLPPMKGKKLMVMSPAGGFTVMMADYCEKIGFEFADPGKEFYDELSRFSNAGVINFSNPLDMGDIYDASMYAHITHEVLHNDHVDGAVYVSQWPNMPEGDNVFHAMFHTDLSTEMQGAILSSGKPLGVTLFGESKTISRIKKNIQFPLFNSPEEMLRALKFQSDFYSTGQKIALSPLPSDFRRDDCALWLKERKGALGEESLELIALSGVETAMGEVASTVEEAVKLAASMKGSVALKIDSPDILHKSDAGGVRLGLRGDDEVKEAFDEILAVVKKSHAGARINGIRVVPMADRGYDMFIGAQRDPAFGPVVFFGYGGIYVEIFNDLRNALAPVDYDDVYNKVKQLKSFSILSGARGGGRADVDAFVHTVVKISHLMSEFPQIRELDCNPVRCFDNGTGAMVLDARMVIE